MNLATLLITLQTISFSPPDSVQCQNHPLEHITTNTEQFLNGSSNSDNTNQYCPNREDIRWCQHLPNRKPYNPSPMVTQWKKEWWLWSAKQNDGLQADPKQREIPPEAEHYAKFKQPTSSDYMNFLNLDNRVRHWMRTTGFDPWTPGTIHTVAPAQYEQF